MSTTEKPVTDFEIVSIEPRQPAELFTPGGTDALIQHVAECVLAVPVDLTTKKGRAAIASAAMKVASSKVFVDKIGKEFVADRKREIGQIDAERKRWCDAMDALKANLRKPLTDWEVAEEKRVAYLAADIAKMESLGRVGPQDTADQIRAAIKKLEDFGDPDFDWEEEAGRAPQIYKTSMTALRTALMARERADADAAELARLRMESEARAKADAERAAKERREQELKEAADRARAQAEAQARLEIEMQAHRLVEAEERAKREANARAAAEAQAVRDAEIAAERAAAAQEAAVQRERQRAEAEKQAAAEKAAKLAANRKHRAKVHAEIVEALAQASASAGVAGPADTLKAIAEAIAAGKIPHLSITY